MNTTPEMLTVLPEIGDALASQLRALQRNPDPALCEAIAIQLDGARRHCLRLACARRQDQIPPEWSDPMWLVKTLSAFESRAGGANGQ